MRIIDQGCLFIAKCEVIYNGRASSSLELGNYLILIKPDKSAAVHGRSFIKPLNYQGPGSTIKQYVDGDEFNDFVTNSLTAQPCEILHVQNRKEELIIGIHQIYDQPDVTLLSDNKIKLIKSERDLVNKIFADVTRYIDINPVYVEMEWQTPYGNVDLLIVDSTGCFHIIEAKRKSVSISGCSQLQRYASHVTESGVQAIKCYLAGPAISKNAQLYASKHNQIWLEIDFDEH